MSTMVGAKRPKALKVHKASNTLELVYADQTYHLTAEFLRVHSPSAEVRGHGQPILQTGKKGVGIQQLEHVGHYGTKITFTDGHDTGIYTWEYFYKLCNNHEKLWSDYLEQLHTQNQSRDANVAIVQLQQP